MPTVFSKPLDTAQRNALEHFSAFNKKLKDLLEWHKTDPNFTFWTREQAIAYCKDALSLYAKFWEHIDHVYQQKNLTPESIARPLATACGIVTSIYLKRQEIDKAQEYLDLSLQLAPNITGYYQNQLMFIKVRKQDINITQKQFLLSSLQKDIEQSTKDFLIAQLIQLKLTNLFYEDDHVVFLENHNPNDIVTLNSRMERALKQEDYDTAITLGEKTLELIQNGTCLLCYMDPKTDTANLKQNIQTKVTYNLGIAYKAKFESEATPEPDKQAYLEKAKASFRTLHKNKIGESAFLIAVMHELNPNATPEDKAEMIACYEAEVQKKNIRAMNNLSHKYFFGEDAPRDIEKAKELLLEIIALLDANQSYAEYPDCINYIYARLHVLFIELDSVEEAIPYLKTAAEYGIKAAACELLTIYISQKRLNEAEPYARGLMATDSENDYLLSCYGYILAFAEGKTAADLDQAVTYLKQSATLGSTQALYFLHQIITEKNYTKLSIKEMQMLTSKALKMAGETPGDDLLEIYEYYQIQGAAKELTLLRETHQLSALQRKIQSVYALYNRSNPDVGIQHLLRLFEKKMDFKNLITLIDTIAKLFKLNTYHTQLTRQAILERLKNTLFKKLFWTEVVAGEVTKAPTTEVFQLLRSLSIFKFSMDTPELQTLITQTLESTSLQMNDFSKTQRILVLYYLSSLLPFQNPALLDLMNQIISELNVTPLPADPYHPLLLQTLATLHFNRIANIPPALIEKTCSATLALIKPEKNPSTPIRQQAYLGLKYFSNTEIDGYTLQIEKKTLARLETQQGKQRISHKKISQLQTRVLNLCQKQFGRPIWSEYPINTLPVDIYLENLDIAIQVDGPTHFIFKGSEMQYAASNCFLDHIIGLNNNTKVVHVHYEEIKARDDDALLALITQRIRDCQSVKILASQADESPSSGKQPAAEDFSMRLQLSRHDSK